MVVQSQFIEQFSGENIPRYELSSLCSEFLDGDWIESKDQSDAGYRLVQTGNVGVGEYIDKSGRARFVSEETFKRLNCTEIFSGDILFSRLPEPLGRCCIIPEAFPKAITAVDCTIARLNEKCLPEFLVVYTATSMYSSQVDKCVTGTTRQRISRNNLAKISVPCPSRDEQIAFVKIVRQADKSKFDGLKSQFIEQFSDERWPLKSISELCDIVTDGEHQTPRRVDSGIYLLSARNVKNQELSFDEVDYIDEQEYQRIAKRIEPQENDVLISCSGSVGRTCVVPKGIRFQLVRSVALLRFKPVVDPLFMSYQMAMPYVQSQIETLKSQTSQANLFQGNIKKIQVIVPSKEEQKQFIIVVRQADKSKYLS